MTSSGAFCRNGYWMVLRIATSVGGVTASVVNHNANSIGSASRETRMLSSRRRTESLESRRN